MAQFDTTLKDSQATAVEPVAPERFDHAAYADYAAEKEHGIRRFVAAPSGVLVYRRVRAGECFAGACRDREHSLALQLGALHKSMAYRADVPNFLEPWYGIGVLAAAYGADYIWQGGAAPAMRPKYGSVEEVLGVNPLPIHKTEIGKRNLAMAEYFMRKTGGRLPISLCDIQSPLNTVGHVMDLNAFFLGCHDDPDAARELLNRMADLMVDYLRHFKALLGDALVMPGHGFASSRCLPGIGVSDDNIVTLSADIYRAVAAESIERMGEAFGGLAYHSCGCYAGKLDMLKQLKGLTCMDAAFTVQTDPAPNRPGEFADALAGTGITLNARMVGDMPTVIETVKSLARPDLKVIVVTYCADEQQQGRAYDAIHEIL